MTIQIGGHTFTHEEVIAAIQASDTTQQVVASPYQTVDELGSILQSVLHRLTALEDRLPITTAGFGVLSTAKTNSTEHKVQMVDPSGKTVLVTFDVPL